MIETTGVMPLPPAKATIGVSAGRRTNRPAEPVEVLAPLEPVQPVVDVSHVSPVGPLVPTPRYVQ